MENPDINSKIHSILESIGLNKNEILLYLELVNHPSSSALDLSKRTGIHRSNTYDSLRRLMEKGFVNEIIKDNKKTFSAIEPEKIKDYLQQKQQEFDLILPQLRNIPSAEEGKDAFSISQGDFAVRESLLDMLKLNSPILVFGAPPQAIETLGEGFLKEFHKERIKNKIEMKHIYSQSAIERINSLNKMKFTEAKYLPKKYDSTVSTNVCGDQIVFFVFSKPSFFHFS